LYSFIQNNLEERINQEKY